jgi:hypothetical protein
VWLCHGIRRGVGGATGLSAVVATVLLSGTPLLSRETVAEVPFELYQHHLIVTKGSIGPLNVDSSCLCSATTIVLFGRPVTALAGG